MVSALTAMPDQKGREFCFRGHEARGHPSTTASGDQEVVSICSADGSSATVDLLPFRKFLVAVHLFLRRE